MPVDDTRQIWIDSHVLKFNLVLINDLAAYDNLVVKFLHLI